jgi:hypothetical protein
MRLPRASVRNEPRCGEAARARRPSVPRDYRRNGQPPPENWIDGGKLTLKHTRPLDEKDVIARFQQVRKAGLSEGVQGVPD